MGNVSTSVKRIDANNEIHLKFVDDFTIAESIKLKYQLEKATFKNLPNPFHLRTEHVLPETNSKVYKQLKMTNQYAKSNLMKMNFKKKQEDLCKDFSSVRNKRQTSNFITKKEASIILSRGL